MFTSLMSNRLYTTYEDTPSQGPGTSATAIGRNLSPSLWKHVGGNGITPTGLGGGAGLFDDFTGGINVAANGQVGQWIFTEANVGTAATLATDAGGVVQLASSTTQYDGASLTGGMVVTLDGDKTATTHKKVIFEARMRKSVITAGSTFVGLAEYALADVDGVIKDDTGIFVATTDVIGFHVNAATPATLFFTYKASGQTVQQPITYGTALTASAWLKVGFIFDPSATDDKRISISIDNEIQSTYVPQSSIYTMSTDTAVATFPDAIPMRPVCAVKAETTTASKLDLDWVACWQED